MDNNRRGQKWTREETILAFELYSRTPFGKIHSRNEDIIRLANLIGRTPGSVGLKMSNLASLDPSLRNRGIVAMPHTSKLDSEIWNEFCEDWESLSYQAQVILDKYDNRRYQDGKCGTDFIQLPEGHMIESYSKERVGQGFFRKAVLSAYNTKCCITGVSLTELLVASHIKPWKDSDPKTERTNPRNGLCLNSLHDKAFDQGLITLDDSYRIILSSRINEAFMDRNTRDWFVFYKDKEIQLPNKFLPDKSFIEYHNDVIFLG